MQLKDIPSHVALIMDGNGRWAKSRHLPRFKGHLEGVKRVEEIAMVANDLGVQVLTVYVFSTENWSRPRSEVKMLMNTLSSVLSGRIKVINKNNIRINVIGQREGAPEEILKSLNNAKALTKINTGLILNLAFNYGGRAEIIQATKKIAKKVKDGKLDINAIDDEVMSDHLFTRGMPDPDLLIRTSGELRISNFLLWQLSYAELYFTEKFWPEFDAQEFKKALLTYQKRERRFGKIDAKVAKQ